jgi:hypothetical protein
MSERELGARFLSFEGGLEERFAGRPIAACPAKGQFVGWLVDSDAADLKFAAIGKALEIAPAYFGLEMNFAWLDTFGGPGVAIVFALPGPPLIDLFDINVENLFRTGGDLDGLRV